ncbi:MAG TPA: hypothetical protein VGR51_10905 [Thermoplasmata archaeon]|nr:hypothetical protein [Thermoplasmata archaeon]
MAAKPGMEKRLEAETATLLKSMLDMELRRIRQDFGFDIAMLVGVDARIFVTSIPDTLTPSQYHLLNLVKANLPAICAQLSREAMKLNLSQYEYGVTVIAQVSDRSFLVLLSGKPQDITAMDETVKNVQRAATVLRHVFQQRPMNADAMASYDKETQEELRRLSRQLFVEKFEETSSYKRNMELAKYLKDELTKSIGVGAVQDVLSVSFNEVGTSAAYMKDDQWIRLIEILVDKVRVAGGDVLADKCAKAWIPEAKRRLKAFA